MKRVGTHNACESVNNAHRAPRTRNVPQITRSCEILKTKTKLVSESPGGLATRGESPLARLFLFALQIGVEF